MKRKVLLALLWLCTVAICVCIFLFSGEVAEDSSEQSGFLRELFTKLFGVGFTEFFIRKLAHISEYAALGFFSTWVFCATFQKPKVFYLGIGFSFLYAISDEIHQRFVPGRSGQVRDVFIDLSGILLGAAVLGLGYLIVKKVRGRKSV